MTTLDITADELSFISEVPEFVSLGMLKDREELLARARSRKDAAWMRFMVAKQLDDVTQEDEDELAEATLELADADATYTRQKRAYHAWKQRVEHHQVRYAEPMCMAFEQAMANAPAWRR